MLTPKCDKCSKQLKQYGALIFSPPKTLASGKPGRKVNKYHICTECWNDIIEFIKPRT